MTTPPPGQRHNTRAEDNAIYNLWTYAQKITGADVDHRRVSNGETSPLSVQLGLPEMSTPEAHYARNRAVTAYADILGLELTESFIMSDRPTIHWRVYTFR